MQITRLPEELNAIILSVPDVRHADPCSPVGEVVVELFDDLRDRLLRYLASFSLAVPDSEDIVQETFLALFQHLRRGKPRQHLRGWLFRVAHNLALKHRRTQRNFPCDPNAASEAANSINRYPSPEDQFASNEMNKRIMAALEALPEQNRLCLHLRAEGLRYREIAEVLGISLGSVSACLARSLAQLARAAKR